MEFLLHILLGIGATYMGLMLPGMVNMSTLRTSILAGRKAGLKFAIGASLVIASYAIVSMALASYLNDHPEVVQRLKKIGFFIFILLSVFFFRRGKVEDSQIGKARSVYPLLQGMVIAGMNIVVIPIFLGLTLLLKNRFDVPLDFPDNIGLVIGIWIGAVCLFSTYAVLADKLISWLRPIARNINYLLGALMITFAFLILAELGNVLT